MSKPLSRFYSTNSLEGEYMKIITALFILVNIGCTGGYTQMDRANDIACENMKTLAAADALPIDPNRQELIRTAFVLDAYNQISEADSADEFTLLAYCDY